MRLRVDGATAIPEATHASAYAWTTLAVRREETLGEAYPVHVDGAALEPVLAHLRTDPVERLRLRANLHALEVRADGLRWTSACNEAAPLADTRHVVDALRPLAETPRTVPGVEVEAKALRAAHYRYVRAYKARTGERHAPDRYALELDGTTLRLADDERGTPGETTEPVCVTARGEGLTNCFTLDADVARRLWRALNNEQVRLSVMRLEGATALVARANGGPPHAGVVAMHRA